MKGALAFIVVEFISRINWNLYGTLVDIESRNLMVLILSIHIWHTKKMRIR